MMQLDKLVLFNRDGETRQITFNAGALNVITGDSRTGKSSLINIVRFLQAAAAQTCRSDRSNRPWPGTPYTRTSATHTF